MSKKARDMAMRHFNKGVDLVEKGLHEKALQTLEQAEKEAKESDSPDLLTVVLQTYGDMLFSSERAAEALERYYAASEILEKNPDFLPPGQRANMFSNMALILEKKGKKEEALDKYNIAVENYRDISDSADYDISNAVSTMNNMGALLGETGRLAEAYEILNEALNLLDSYGTDNEPQQQKRITVLENIFNIPLEETEDIDKNRYSELIEQFILIDDTNRGSLKMSKALRNIALIHEKQGEKEAALKKLEDALEIASGHFDRNADDPVSRKMLVDILRDMNRLLEDEKQSEKLLEMYGTILQMSRKLLASMPENTSYQLNVAFSLNIIGNLLRNEGRVAEATEKIKESVDIAVDVFEKEKDDSSSVRVVVSIIEDMLDIIDITDNGSSRLELYSSLESKLRVFGEDNLEIGLIVASICSGKGKILNSRQRYAEALESFGKALVIYETVRHATGDISDMEYVLEDMAQTQTGMGLADEALESYMRLVKLGTSAEKYAAHIERILQEKEKAAMEKGNIEIMRREYEKIIGIRTDMLGLIPDDAGKNAENIRLLQEKIADIMAATDKIAEALQMYEQLQEADGSDRYTSKIIKTLEKMNSRGSWQQDESDLEKLQFMLSRYESILGNSERNSVLMQKRAGLIEKIAFVLLEKGETDKSGGMYRDALKVYAGISEIEPANAYPVERIAAIHARMAEIAGNCGNTEEAESRYESSLQTYNMLMDANPASISYRLDYAGILDGMGAFYLKMSLHSRAKTSYEKALKAYGDLMDFDPSNSSFRENVTITLENLGYVLELMGRKEDAMWMYENARKLHEGIE